MSVVEYSNSVNAPKTLDIRFFEEVLEGALLEAFAEIKKISFEMGTAAGENYCSKIYRVRVTFKRENVATQDISVIIKSITPLKSAKFLEDLQFFLKEKIFYTNVLPRLEILLDKVKFGAKLYYSQKEPINTLVFEDLAALGYVMQDRIKGLDLEHSNLVMKKLGQFHGISMIMQAKEPESMDMFQHGFLSEKGVNGSDFFEMHFGNSLKGVLELISDWEGFEAIAAKVEKIAANLKENLIKSQLPIPGELKVLNQGDLWTNNVMFKYKDDSRQEVEDVVFLDFQMSIYGSPGYDIVYIMYGSSQLDVLREKKDELISTYYEAMSNVLKSHNYSKVPELADILREVRLREFYGFFAVTGSLPVIAMDKTHSVDNSLDKFSDGESAKKNREMLFSSKRVRDTLRYALKNFDEMGVLD